MTEEQFNRMAAEYAENNVAAMDMATRRSLTPEDHFKRAVTWYLSIVCPPDMLARSGPPRRK